MEPVTARRSRCLTAAEANGLARASRRPVPRGQFVDRQFSDPVPAAPAHELGHWPGPTEARARWPGRSARRSARLSSDTLDEPDRADCSGRGRTYRLARSRSFRRPRSDGRCRDDHGRQRDRGCWCQAPRVGRSVTAGASGRPAGALQSQLEKIRRGHACLRRGRVAGWCGFGPGPHSRLVTPGRSEGG